MILADLAPAVVCVLCASGVLAPLVMQPGRFAVGSSIAVTVLIAIGLFAESATVGYGALAVAPLVLAVPVWRQTRTGAFWLGVAAAVTAVAAMAMAGGALELAFVTSTVAIALRGGAMPLHFGVAALTDAAPERQTQQLATTIALVFLHLRHVDHQQIAYDLAPAIVRIGAVATLLPALFTLVVRDLRGLVRNAVLMHGGMLLAAVGAAGHGHYAAALLASITLGVAVGGFVLIAAAFERRVGASSYDAAGGWARAYPVLTVAFACLGAAGVGMPGTAGFVADDLLLHALWEESVGGTAAVIVASGCLAIGTLRGFARTFLGPQRPSFAPDLLGYERFVVLVLMLVLVAIGLVPELILEPAEAMLGS